MAAARRPGPVQLPLHFHTVAADTVLAALQDPDVQEAISAIVRRAIEADRAAQQERAQLVTDAGAAEAVGVSLKTFRRWYARHASLAALATKPGRQAERWPLTSVRAWWEANYRK